MRRKRKTRTKEENILDIWEEGKNERDVERRDKDSEHEIERRQGRERVRSRNEKY